MRFLTAAALAAILITGGCKRIRHANPSATIEEAGELSSTLQIGSPDASSQILHGFHGAEAGSWRWSQRKFAVSLAAPPASAEKGATLEMVFTVPDTVFQTMNGAVLKCSIAGVPLAPSTITKTGEQTYKADVPASALKREAVIAEFELDRAVPPGQLDSRELALVVSRIALLTK